jgi:uncharacterized alpha-E superfamily protein
MADETNPRSLDFQLDHLVELYEKLPRNDPADLAGMYAALKTLRAIDLQRIPFSASNKTARGQQTMKHLDRFLSELENLLPKWSNDLSSRYFSHARTLPVRMGQ